MSIRINQWKVPEETRRAILKEYRNNPSYSYQELATKFGIAESTAWKIVNAGRQTCTEALDEAHQNIANLTAYIAQLKETVKRYEAALKAVEASVEVFPVKQKPKKKAQAK